MKGKATIAAFGLLSAALFAVWAIGHFSTNWREFRAIPLASIRGISSNVLAAQDKIVHIDDPVECLAETNLYFFSVSILATKHFGANLDYEFVGDPKRIDHFVKEVAFVDKNYGGGVGMTEQVATGAADDIIDLAKSLFEFLVNAIFHPKNTAHDLIHVLGAVKDYSGRFFQGEVNPWIDSKAFAAAYFENLYMQIAAKRGLNYEELITPEAKNSTRRLGKSEFGGTVVAEVAQLFFVWTKIGKLGEAAKVADVAAEGARAAETADVVAGAAKVYEGLNSEEKTAKAAVLEKFFRYGVEAKEGAARAALFASKEKEVADLALKNLLNPKNIESLITPRPLNTRLNKVMYWLHQKEISGSDVSSALTKTMKEAGADKRIPKQWLDPQLDHDQLFKNYNNLKALKVFENNENLYRLRHGKSPLAEGPTGPIIMEVGHEVPVSRAPELEKSWGNLSYQTREHNQAIGNIMTQSSKATLQRYEAAGLLSQKRINEIVAGAAK